LARPVVGIAKSMTVSTGVDSLDRSTHNANVWLNDLVDELGEDRHAVYRVLRAFLHLLRDRLPSEEGAHLAAQLPHLWRGVFYDGWTPSRTPESFRDRDTFLTLLADEAQLADSTEASHAAEACAKVLRAHIDERELRRVLAVLPGALVPLLAAA
jgi:uncharacterized protein (DUF2267 family)